MLTTPELILKLVWQSKTRSFSGIGIVFYHSLSVFPFVPLGNQTSIDLPINETTSIVVKLAAVADISCPQHDGFHFINVSSGALTHLSQYISPPLVSAECIALERRPSGARRMTALLASSVEGIDCVGLLDTVGVIEIYRSGAIDTGREDADE